jgi:hypothetical protein
MTEVILASTKMPIFDSRLTEKLVRLTTLVSEYYYLVVNPRRMK